MTTSRCLVFETRFDSEPASWLDRLLPSLRRLVEAVAPTWMFACSPQGRVSRDRKVKWSAIEELASAPTTGTIVMTAHEVAAPLTIEVYLRHNPGIELEFQPPAVVWLGAEGPLEHMQDVLAVSNDFLAFAAAVPGVLHGGITLVDNLAQARSEVTGTGTDVDTQPPTFVRRREHDWRLKTDLWNLVRRAYWTTLLGPKLAAAVGGADAARAAGAVDVQELGGSLLFRAMEGPPRDSLDPEFLAATLRLRRWLWPHTFKNPLDAAGFEAEVGLPIPGAPA